MCKFQQRYEQCFKLDSEIIARWFIVESLKYVSHAKINAKGATCSGSTCAGPVSDHRLSSSDKLDFIGTIHLSVHAAEMETYQTPLGYGMHSHFPSIWFRLNKVGDRKILRVHHPRAVSVNSKNVSRRKLHTSEVFRNLLLTENSTAY